MRPIESRLLAATAVMVVATITLGACAQAQPDEASAPVPSSAPDETATPTPTPTTGGEREPGTTGTATPPQTAEPTADEAAPVELVDFETQNGTMRMRIPAAWTVEDHSRIAVDVESRQRWDNTVSISDADGGSIWFSDGQWDSVGAAPSEVSVVAQIPVGDGLAATAWWQRYDESFGAYVALTNPEDPGFAFTLEGGSRILSLAFQHPDAFEPFPTATAAEEYLRGDVVELALDLLATVELTGEDDALPAGIGVEHEGTTYLPYTTQNGTASFLVPQHWRIEDHSRRGTNRAGQEVWDNSVALYLPNGNMVLHYGDMWFTNLIEEWEWTLGEVRPTQTDGWQAVSWTLGDSVPNHAGYVGVSLSDQGGAVRPADNVCSENLCRSFSSIPLSVRWLDDGLDSTEDFFGSAIEEQLLTAVASLETHHDDATRMPW
ncbi:hypothetical protein [Agrococcus jenensis]|uniref:Uncharacterized protein n=1 Tax=Agrococcus jenensis TaxID=46353 RepID=A0A3N2AQP8_9MICO|nr:hypothetical protein [Agrococcus jenensis]ROR65354.1 hypothetical protein EDD26_0720 [Agrococcus jenensis]